MLRYDCGTLSARTLRSLKALQDKVDAKASHEEKYDSASALFASKTTKAWQEIRLKLAAVSPPGMACFYCERDRYRDIDHIRPKRHYPEQCFAWDNYVYACTICNQVYKKDTYAVFDTTGAIVKFDRSLPFTSPVPAGDHVLIDPRSEDPLDFLRLDLSTGRFTAVGNARSVLRGEFTRELFDLNETTLAKIRVAACETFKHYLMRFQAAIQAQDHALAQRVLSEIRELPHPTVLVEMRLQSAQNVALAAHFINVPADIGGRP